MWSVFKLAARAAVWRTTPDPPLVGLPSLLGWAVTLALMRVALQFAATAGEPSHFNPYGLNAVVAWLAFQLAIAAFFVRPAASPTALTAMFILSIIADVAAALVQFGGPLLPSNTQLDALWSHAPVAAAFYAIEIGWWLGAMTCVLGGVQPNSRLRLLARSAALWVALFAAHALMPDAPVFVAPEFDIRSANWWEYLYARYGRKKSRRLEKEHRICSKPKSTPGAAAPGHDRHICHRSCRLGRSGGFRQGARWRADLDRDCAADKGSYLRLINNRETVSSMPLATPKNFSAAVHAVGGVMDKDEDVLSSS